MLLEDGLGDGKPQTGALLAGVRAGAVVPVKDIGQVGGGNARAVVLHLYPHALGAAEGTQDKNTVLADVVHGVAQQIVQRPLHHVWVGIDWQLLFRQLQLQLPAVLGADCVVALAYFIAQLPHVKVHPLALIGAAGHLAQFHHAGDQCGQAVGLVHDDVHLLVPVRLIVAGQVTHRLGVALDEGQRGAQVVGDIGQQVALHLHCVLHLLGHVVKVPGKVAQLVVAAVVHLHGVVAQRHLPCGAGKLAQRLCEPLAEQPRRRHGKAENQRRCQRQQGAEHLAGLGNVHKAGGHQHGVAAVGGGAPYQQLRRAGEPGRVERLHKAAHAAALAAHGKGSGNDLIVVGRIRKIGAVQVAEGLVLDLINGVQGSVRDIHAEAVQGALGVQFQRELIKKIAVD